LVEEACSGINSVLFMTSTCVFYAMWRRRSLVFLAVLYALTIGCVLAGNLVRITSGAWLVFNWDIDLFSGPRHEALGMGLTAVYLGFIVAAEAVLGRISGRPGGGGGMLGDGQSSGVEWQESLSHWRPARRVVWLAVPLALLFAGQVVQMRQHVAGPRVINPVGMDGPLQHAASGGRVAASLGSLARADPRRLRRWRVFTHLAVRTRRHHRDRFARLSIF
jgi:exosortase/archaeosortase family protein